MGAGVGRAQDLEVEQHSLEVEWNVTLGLPPDRPVCLTRLHSRHLHLLDEHVVATQRDRHLARLYARLPHQLANRVDNGCAIHNLAVHDRAAGRGADRHASDLGAVSSVIEHGELDETAADVEAHRGPLARKQRHRATPFPEEAVPAMNAWAPGLDAPGRLPHAAPPRRRKPIRPRPSYL